MLYSHEAEHEPGTILIAGKDKKLHKARVVVRCFKRNSVTGSGYDRKYLYLTHRDGKTVKQIYLGKLG